MTTTFTTRTSNVASNNRTTHKLLARKRNRRIRKQMNLQERPTRCTMH